MADYKYTPADFKSDQEVRWCPGCGDHAILNAVQRALPEIADATDTPHNRFTFVSGIGCSSRFIYYMKTFGFHSVHGRANAVATGVKVANPELAVWVCTGDGDSLAIGGNHFIHAIRRNVDLNVILFNNEIYGLTKGQYSPTSKLGKITKTSPYGTVEKPFNPGELVIGAKGSFFARSVDMEVALSKDCFISAAKHAGMSVVEILQNCVIFNDKTHASFAADKATRAEHTITLRHGEKMLFGAQNEKGLVFENMKLKVVTVGQDGYTSVSYTHLDVAVAQLDEIRDIQSVAQIEKKPVVAVAESRIFAVVVFGDRSYLLDGECHFSARTLLDGIAPLPERIVHLFDDAVGFRAVEYPAERSHVDGDSCLAFALRVHEILEPHEPRGRNVLILQIAGRELAHGPQQCSKDIRRTDVARGPLFFFARGNGFQYGFRAAAFDAGVEQTE